MVWIVRFHDVFEEEFAALAQEVQDELLTAAKLLRELGPKLGRPHVDTLKGSKFANMKELRFRATDGEWRTAFAFDPTREAILLVAGDKSGGHQNKFYKRLIAKADERYQQHLDGLKAETGKKAKKDK
jgi:hypothetical protein